MHAHAATHARTHVRTYVHTHTHTHTHIHTHTHTHTYIYLKFISNFEFTLHLDNVWRCVTASDENVRTIFAMSYVAAATQSGSPPRWESPIPPFRLLPSPALRTITFTCPAVGDPKPSITWLKNGASFEARQSGKVQITLLYVTVNITSSYVINNRNTSLRTSLSS